MSQPRAHIRRAGLLGILGVTFACADTEQPALEGPVNGTMVADSGNLDRRYYERNFVFASVAADSVFLVPWLMQTIEDPEYRDARSACLAGPRGRLGRLLRRAVGDGSDAGSDACIVPHLGLSAPGARRRRHRRHPL